MHKAMIRFINNKDLKSIWTPAGMRSFKGIYAQIDDMRAPVVKVYRDNKQVGRFVRLSNEEMYSFMAMVRNSKVDNNVFTLETGEYFKSIKIRNKLKKQQ